MANETPDSTYIQRAFALLDSVRGRPQTLEERKNAAVELASLMLNEANRIMTWADRRQQAQLRRLMEDKVGKAFTTSMTDQCFRSSSKARVADQMCFLLSQLGIPKYLSLWNRLGLHAFQIFGKIFPWLFVPLTIFFLRRQTAKVILPGEKNALEKHIKKRTAERVKHNLNHLGEAILSEQEAKRRLQFYLDDLANPLIHYVSVKISTIFSQINLLAWNDSIEQIAERLRCLYRAAIINTYTWEEGEDKTKFINLDMEEYRDLHLTIAVFKKVLEEPEFHHLSAGIVLQAYLPDSHNLQKELTEWAKSRLKNGGASIKIRIVKGANLAMEQFEASLKTWPQAPYKIKNEVDSNFKKMVIYGSIAENARAVHLGIASHNLFDIAFAMLLRAENQVESYTHFEMLEGMADPIRRVVQEMTGDILLYCPVAKKEDFRHAIAYLIRRLDENTGQENFLRYLFGLKPGTPAWDNQVELFLKSCDGIEGVYTHPRRNQNRQEATAAPPIDSPFENEADTDFSLPANRAWAEKIVEKFQHYKPNPIPIVIGEKEYLENQDGKGFNPSHPKTPLFSYMLATEHHIETSLQTAKNAEKEWTSLTFTERNKIFYQVANTFREKRGEFLGLMLLEGGKIIPESDPEFSEVVDYIEYYRRQMERILAFIDIQWSPKGTILVTPPWNFPAAIPVGGIVSALLTGNCVIFKPAPEAVLIGWHIANIFWEAGVPKKVLQFINCNDDPQGSMLIKDPRINCVILTGATATARKFLQMRPGLDLAGETGGKNPMIITALSDRDLAIKDLIHSAFSHSGQKCSAVSLAILEAEVYDDPHFKKQLKEAVSSLKVGPAHDLSVKIGPLIKEPGETLQNGLTTLEEGEEWLLEPAPVQGNPNLWTPGIKWGVKLGSFTQKNELFGPVLGVMRAKNFSHALALANATEYGLTAGLQTLDEREQEKWIQQIEAGNCYINRTTTGAIVRRQPFGGYKRSSFGNGSKTGGPNYIRELMHAKQVGLPQEKKPVNEAVNTLTTFIEKLSLSAEELGMWYASISNYSYWWKRMNQNRDPTKLVGQDNFFFYIPRKDITIRLDGVKPVDGLRIIAAALTCRSPVEISWNSKESNHHFQWKDVVPLVCVVDETEEEFLKRISTGLIKRVRMLTPSSQELKLACALSGCHIVESPVLANGRFELLHYLREVSLSVDYHRYGNLGIREGEPRKQVL